VVRTTPANAERDVSKRSVRAGRLSESVDYLTTATTEALFSHCLVLVYIGRATTGKAEVNRV